MVRCLTEDGTRLSAGWLGLIFRWSWEMLFLKLFCCGLSGGSLLASVRMDSSRGGWLMRQWIFGGEVRFF